VLDTTVETSQFDFEQSYFDLFELPIGCSLDAARLRDNFMQLQRQYHPDRFAAAEQSVRTRAVQIAAFINSANQTLGNPLKRAEYCLTLAGVTVDSETDSKMDPMFLMQQMELREALEDVESSDDPHTALESVEDEIQQLTDSLEAQASSHIESNDYPAARDVIRKWQFLVKLSEEAKSLEAKLDEV